MKRELYEGNQNKSQAMTANFQVDSSWTKGGWR